jgi:hypothetical protein
VRWALFGIALLFHFNSCMRLDRHTNRCSACAFLVAGYAALLEHYSVATFLGVSPYRYRHHLATPGTGLVVTFELPLRNGTCNISSGQPEKAVGGQAGSAI